MSLSRKNNEELKTVVMYTVIRDGLDFARSVDLHSIYSENWWEKKEKIERKKEKLDEENTEFETSCIMVWFVLLCFVLVYCNVPEPYWSPHWVLVPAKPA
jgi:uncharacterized membrane protein YidH (DUF202 family)